MRCDSCNEKVRCEDCGIEIPMVEESTFTFEIPVSNRGCPCLCHLITGTRLTLRGCIHCLV